MRGGLAELPVEVAEQPAEGVEISMTSRPDEETTPRIHRSEGTGTTGHDTVDIYHLVI